MRRLSAIALALTGCISDLAVGMSSAEISDDDAGAIVQEHDAGSAATLDASEPALDASSEAAVEEEDATEPDAAPPYLLCELGDCRLGFIAQLTCFGGAQEICARPSPDQGCAWTCP
jgi:hypothetical protein